jgi:hypothetical protein
MHRIMHAETLPGFRVRLRFSDGLEGIADFTPLVTKGGAYQAIAAAPEAARIGMRGRSLEWPGADGEAVDFCADALRLTVLEARAAE